MTAITISAPPARLRTRGAQPQRPADRARPVASAAPLRLTRRGRLVITAVLVAVGVAVSLFAGGIGFAGTDVRPVPVRYVTVMPGQTLWAIAGEVAPNADRRDTVSRILELNAMPGAAVQAGQRIAVPAR